MWSYTWNPHRGTFLFDFLFSAITCEISPCHCIYVGVLLIYFVPFSPRPPCLPPKPQKMRRPRPLSVYNHKLFNGNMETFIKVLAGLCRSVCERWEWNGGFPVLAACRPQGVPQLAWPARLGLGDFSPQLPLCIPGVPVPSAVCSGPHPWLVATCSVGQSWLSVLIVLLLLSIPRRKMGSAQPSPQRSNRHTPLPVLHMVLVVIHPCG